MRGSSAVNDEELRARVRESMFRQCHMRGYAAPVDVLMDIGALSKKNYEDWRFGRADTLERVCSMNLSKLSAVLREMYACAKAQSLKPSFCYYKRWGVKKKGQGRGAVIPCASAEAAMRKLNADTPPIMWTKSALHS